MNKRFWSLRRFEGSDYTYEGFWDNFCRISIGILTRDVTIRKLLTRYNGFVYRILARKLDDRENIDLDDYTKNITRTLTFTTIILGLLCIIFSLAYGEVVLALVSFIFWLYFDVINSWVIDAYKIAQRKHAKIFLEDSLEHLDPLEIDDKVKMAIPKRLAELDIALANGRGVVEFSTMVVEVKGDELGVVCKQTGEFIVSSWTTPNNAKEIIREIFNSFPNNAFK